MKKLSVIILLLIAGIGCKPRVISGKELENKLIETMADYLKKSSTTGAEFQIKSVTYFPNANKKLYDCEFSVNMHLNNKDTIGIMKAKITNDFKNVERIQ